MKFIFFQIVTFMLLIISGCTTIEIDMSQPEKAFNGIKKHYYDDERYEDAISKFNELRSKYPYHHLSVEAELLIAESYFAQEKWAEGSVSFEEFIKLHPTHAQVKNAMYKNALCYYNQKNSTVDRDQTPTKEAITIFENYLKQVNQGKDADDIRKKLQESRLQHAESIQFVARFYFKKELYSASYHKYQYLIEQFSDIAELMPEAYSRSAISCYEMALFKKSHPDTDRTTYEAHWTVEKLKNEGKRIVDEFKKKFPKSADNSDIKSIETKLKS